MAIDEKEFGNLIGSDKVEGTAVFGVDENKIGSIERVMIDKVSGKVSYAVLGFGGFLGLGNDHYSMAVPEIRQAARQLCDRSDRNQLRGAPRFSGDRDWNWADTAGNRVLDDYYGVPIP